MQQKKHSSSAVRGFMAIGTLYSYLYCMMASSVLVSIPILGGALYMAGRAAVLFIQLQRPVRKDMISKSQRRTGSILLGLIFLVMLGLITLHHAPIANANIWFLAAVVLCLLIRPLLSRYALEKGSLSHEKPSATFWHLAAVQVGFLPLFLLLLFSPLHRDVIWSLLGGFLLSGLLECFSLDKMCSRLHPYTEEDRKEMEALRGVHAYRMFQNIMLVVAAALQITQVMTFTYIAMTAGALILCMAIALLCTFAACLLAKALLHRPFSKESDPSFLMLGGLVVWLYGLVLFIRCLSAPASAGVYIALALSTLGATLCARILAHMEGDMRQVAAFGIGHTPGDILDIAQHARVDFASLLGQMIALLGLTLIYVFSGDGVTGGLPALFEGFSPLMTVPALLLVAAALIFVLLFPMTSQHIEKLRRYMDLQAQGKENAPLHAQLEAVLVSRSFRHYGIKILMFFIRLFYFHRIRGRENIQLDKDIPCVFVCNHGEIYGPIVTNLYVPYSFRPWVTYEMMDRAVVTDRVCNGALKDQKILPPKAMRWIVDKIAARFLVWIMKSVDSIPVYHDNPRKLMQTFRETIAAMEAGDNILLFPENSQTSETHRYLREGVSEFFTGFTMIGQMYYNKMGKSVQFIPLYANKRKRTITFGVPTRYNPDAPVNEEKERLCAYLREEMLRVADLEKPDEAQASK